MPEQQKDQPDMDLRILFAIAVLAFDSVVESPPTVPPGLAPAVDRHRFRAVEHLSRMDARGGTEATQRLPSQ